MSRATPIKLIAALSIFSFLTGCSSIVEYAAEARASYDAGIYKTISSAAMEDAKNYCFEKFLNKAGQVKENPEILKTCVEQDYQQRMEFYLSRSGNRNSNEVTTSRPGSTKVYNSDECIGSVINGQCHGSIIPKSGYHKTCYGEMINGQCTGPMF